MQGGLVDDGGYAVSLESLSLRAGPQPAAASAGQPAPKTQELHRAADMQQGPAGRQPISLSCQSQQHQQGHRSPPLHQERRSSAAVGAASPARQQQSPPYEVQMDSASGQQQSTAQPPTSSARLDRGGAGTQRSRLQGRGQGNNRRSVQRSRYAAGKSADVK